MSSNGKWVTTLTMSRHTSPTHNTVFSVPRGVPSAIAIILVYVCCQGSKLYRSGEDQHRRIAAYTSRRSLINGKDTQNGRNINTNASNSGHFRNKTKTVSTCIHARALTHTHTHARTHFFLLPLCTVCVSTPLAVRPSLIKKWTWDL